MVHTIEKYSINISISYKILIISGFKVQIIIYSKILYKEIVKLL